MTFKQFLVDDLLYLLKHPSGNWVDMNPAVQLYQMLQIYYVDKDLISHLNMPNPPNINDYSDLSGEMDPLYRKMEFPIIKFTE